MLGDVCRIIASFAMVFAAVQVFLIDAQLRHPRAKRERSGSADARILCVVAVKSLPMFAPITPLCPAGHLPRKEGDWLLSRLSPISTVTGVSVAPKPLISPLAGEMSGRTEGGAVPPASRRFCTAAGNKKPALRRVTVPVDQLARLSTLKTVA
ncbi:MAG: hypothetical protein EOS27_24195 [Mesorhizobium sp.]|nr:MAG: hypothetical protein EOS27_24195 [Mesorhizobium sp.]